MFTGHLQEEYEEKKPGKHDRRSLLNALLAVDSFPTSGYGGKRTPSKFVITHPDLPPAVVLEPQP